MTPEEVEEFNRGLDTIIAKVQMSFDQFRPAYERAEPHALRLLEIGYPAFAAEVGEESADATLWLVCSAFRMMLNREALIEHRRAADPGLVRVFRDPE